MQDVLLQLALTSNGRTSSYDPSGGGDHDHSPALGPGDAPHLHFAALWEAATSDGERARILQDAQDVLQSILHSNGNPGRVETIAELYRRIVDDGDGWPARDVANRFRCGIKVVWAARAQRDRDIDYGRPLRNGRTLTPEQRQAEVRRLAGEEGMSARQIAVSLRVGYNTVRRDLGRCA